MNSAHSHEQPRKGKKGGMEREREGEEEDTRDNS